MIDFDAEMKRINLQFNMNYSKRHFSFSCADVVSVVKCIFDAVALRIKPKDQNEQQEAESGDGSRDKTNEFVGYHKDCQSRCFQCHRQMTLILNCSIS